MGYRQCEHSQWRTKCQAGTAKKFGRSHCTAVRDDVSPPRITPLSAGYCPCVCHSVCTLSMNHFYSPASKFNVIHNKQPIIIVIDVFDALWIDLICHPSKQHYISRLWNKHKSGGQRPMKHHGLFLACLCLCVHWHIQMPSYVQYVQRFVRSWLRFVTSRPSQCRRPQIRSAKFLCLIRFLMTI